MNDRYRTDLFVQHLYRDHPGKLRFDPETIKTPGDFFAWKEQVRAKALELMQFPADAYDTPLVNQISVVQRDGYRVEKYEISPEPELWVPFLLLVPDSASKAHPAPGVLCFPGWSTPKEALCGEDFRDGVYDPSGPAGAFPFSNAMALHFVRRGMVALASDNAGTGEQQGVYDRQQFALKMMFKGRNYAGLSVLYRWAMFKWLAEQEYVDDSRMGLAGHSFGTETSMFLALLEPRVKAVSHNDFMSDNDQRIISCFPPEEFMFGGHIHLVPGMLEWFGFPDLIAAFAPGHMLLSEGGVQDDLERIGKAYELAGAPERYRFVHYPEFQDPQSRLYDHKPIPEGITNEEYFRYANVVPEHHFYKSDLCVPWMEKALRE